MNYRRILYKISGEALMGSQSFGYDLDIMRNIAEDISVVRSAGVEVCLVVGGGNICRGSSISTLGLERTTGDYMGMLATMMNAIAMQSILERDCGIETRVMSALPIKQVCEIYIQRRAIRHIEKGRVVIFSAGIGSPFFTTDTSSVLRAIEVNCDAVFKGTGVDGVYSDDPRKNPNAERYQAVSYQQVLEQNLRFMDPSAISLARDNHMPIVLFSIKNSKTPLSDAMTKKGLFTTVC